MPGHKNLLTFFTRVVLLETMKKEIIFTLTAFTVGLSCSSVPKNEHNIHRIFSNNVHIRRPIGQGADPKAMPGGEDYQSKPLPNEKYDCEKLQSLFKEVRLNKFMECISNITTPVTLQYLLIREPRPYFVLEENEQNKSPECLKQTLEKIPVPREILFQSDENNGFECYSSRLDLEKDETLGTKVPGNSFYLLVNLPPARKIHTDEEAVRFLGALALTPFWDEETKTLKSKIVPENICIRCMGETAILKEGNSVPAYWP